MIASPEQLRRRLRLVHWVAVLDAVLLVALVAASFTRHRDLVRVLGPLHGGNFLLLATVVGVGAVDGLWRWWFPIAVVLTGGPIGALFGEWQIGKQLHAADAKERS